MVAIEPESSNDATWHWMMFAPLTNEARSDAMVQNRGIFRKVTCTVEPSDENSGGKTLMTVIGGGAKYSMVSEIFTGTIPSKTNLTKEVPTAETLGEANVIAVPLRIAEEPTSKLSIKTFAETNL
jgi:hypothetical protein